MYYSSFNKISKELFTLDIDIDLKSKYYNMHQEEIEMQEEYVTIGTSVISNNVFRNVLRPVNNFSFKPSGGLWASKKCKFGISEWFNYLVEAEHKPYIYYTKNINKATSFTLKKDANILFLNNYDDVKSIAAKYPSVHHNLSYYKELTPERIIFDFEKISKVYDGVYINYFNIRFHDNIDIFNNWNSNTLLLFNLDCIDKYTSLDIAFDINLNDDYPVISDISSSKTIQNRSQVYNLLYDLSLELLENFTKKYTSFKDYNDYLVKITLYINNCIDTIIQSNKSEVKLLNDIIISEGIILPKEYIIRNLLLNCLSKYLEKNENRIKRLSKSPIKRQKWYNL